MKMKYHIYNDKTGRMYCGKKFDSRYGGSSFSYVIVERHEQGTAVGTPCKSCVKNNKKNISKKDLENPKT
jgi:hypothetical protein